MKKILFGALLIIFALSYTATITWRGSVFVNSDFTVSSTDILVIEAGTRVRFGYAVRLIVYGQIQSQGTESDPVYMSPVGENYWGGIEINSMSGTSQLNYTVFKAIDVPWGTGRGGLTFNNSSVNVSNCRFLSNYSESGGAIRIISGNVNVSGSYFYMNGAPEGGAIYVLNDSPSFSQVNINGCRFEHNDAGIKGGAIFVQDTQTSNNMDLNIIKCQMFGNYTGEGGALYYDNQGHIDLEFSKSKIFSNNADRGSAIFMRFMEIIPGNILAQKFSNLIVFKNFGSLQSGVFIDMGLTQNPQNLNFTNVTVAYNSASEINKCGVYIKSNGNFPRIRNSILWNNTNFVGENNFFIEDSTFPSPNMVFKYCDIGGFPAEQPNISADPIFLRAPQSSMPQEFDIDTYDFHLSVLSPCYDAGDPAEPCFELNSSRVDMGAYGNTMESVRPFTTVNAADVSTNLVIPGGQAVVLDFQGKAIKASWNDLVLNSNSEIYIKSAYDADFSFKRLIANSKFDGGVVRIHTLAETSTTGQKLTAPQELVIEESVNLSNADFNDVKLKFQKNTPMTASVNLNNTKFFTKDRTMPYAVEIITADTITVENSKFLNFTNGGIKIGTDNPINKSKASGRISNNTVSSDASESTKDKAGKRVGLEIANAHMDVENNSIEGGDEGIAMKANSSGRITNNTVSFDASESTKGYIKKAITVSGNSTPSEISGNTIFSYDYSSTTDVIGIEVNCSSTKILYNKMYYGSAPSGCPRTGISIIDTPGTTDIINNTIHGPFTAFNISYSVAPVPVNVINNIYWSYNSPYTTINDTTEVAFLNNCFIDSTNISGSGNIFADPKLDYVWEGDFSLSSTSPCINAGIVVDSVHVFPESKSFYYYGSAPDMGAEEYYQELSSPSNLTTEVSGGNISFGWDAVPGYPYYKIYASNDPYGTFTVVDHTASLTYTSAITDKKFIYVVATTEPPSKIYSADTAETKEAKVLTPNRKMRSFRVNQSDMKK